MWGGYVVAYLFHQRYAGSLFVLCVLTALFIVWQLNQRRLFCTKISFYLYYIFIRRCGGIWRPIGVTVPILWITNTPYSIWILLLPQCPIVGSNYTHYFLTITRTQSWCFWKNSYWLLWTPTSSTRCYAQHPMVVVRIQMRVSVILVVVVVPRCTQSTYNSSQQYKGSPGKI